MLLKMSVSGGVLILFLMIIRQIAGRRLPRRVLMLLWAVALLRLLVPVELPIKYGIAVPAVEAVERAAEKSDIFVGNKGGFEADRQAEGADLRGAGDGLWEESSDWPGVGFGLREASSGLRGVDFGLKGRQAVIWFFGALGLALFFIVSYLRELKKIREALPLPKEKETYLRELADIPERVRIRNLDKIFSPMVFGILRPQIILPGIWQPENERQMKYVLTHEVVHIRRADNFWKIMMLAALCIHWFHPLVWMMYVMFNRDMELSCDELVIRKLGGQAKKEYAMTLVALAEKQRHSALFSIGFGKNAVRERIVGIMKFRKLTIWSVACLVILAGIFVTAFAKGTAGRIAEDRSLYSAESYEEGAASGRQGTDSEGTKGRMKGILADSEYFPEYEKYGLSYDARSGHLMYGGEIVGHFHDETSKGVYTHLTDEDGKVSFIVARDSDNRIVGVTSEEISRKEERVEEDNRLAKG